MGFQVSVTSFKFDQINGGLSFSIPAVPNKPGPQLWGCFSPATNLEDLRQVMSDLERFFKTRRKVLC